MRKLKRAELIRAIIRQTGIPDNANSLAYFTRQQLVELKLYIDKQSETIAHLSKGGVDSDGQGEV